MVYFFANKTAKWIHLTRCQWRITPAVFFFSNVKPIMDLWFDVITLKCPNWKRMVEKCLNDKRVIGCVTVWVRVPASLSCDPAHRLTHEHIGYRYRYAEARARVNRDTVRWLNDHFYRTALSIFQHTSFAWDNFFSNSIAYVMRERLDAANWILTPILSSGGLMDCTTRISSEV